MRILNINTWLTALLLLATVGTATAQGGETHVVRDFEVWTAAAFRYEPTKDWRIELQQQFRFKDDASTTDQYFTQLELKRDLGKHFSAALAGRYISRNDTEGRIQGFENRFRWQADVMYKHDIDRLRMKYRLRYQSRTDVPDEGDIAETAFRIKAGAAYNIKNWKFDPKFSAELFNGLSNDEGFNRLRMTLGTDYSLKKYGELGAFYRMEIELIGAYPKTTNIAGFSYQYTLKNKKK